MKFSEFKQACRGILDRIGAARFRSIALRLHDVESSSQFAQAVFPAGGVDAANGILNIRPGRRPTTLAEILSKAAELAERLGGDPEMAAAGDRVFVFGYDQQQNAAIASFGLPAEEEVDESILDAPRDKMDPAVWRDPDSDRPSLSDEAARTIAGIREWAAGEGWIGPRAGVHVIGSIASNQYSDESDVDVHFYGDIDFGEEDTADFNRRFRDAFAEFAEENPEYAEIGGRRVEVFAQPNEFHDMMSVGCYDVDSGEWLSGPGVQDTAFDPYSEYYDDDMEYAGGLVDEVRRAVFSTYEKAVVYRKTTDEAFKEKIGRELLADAARAARLFERIRGMRNAVSSPSSREEALRLRGDRRWHVADSAFKLLDKFGYTSVCWACREAADGGDPAAAAETVLGSVAENIAGNAALSEEDRSQWTLDEGLGSALRAAALAGMTMAAGIAGTAHAEPGGKARAPARRVAQAKEPSYAGLSRSNMVNLLATIAYNEAMQDWMKNRNDDAIVAILNVIDNRAGGDPNHYAQEISAKSQFFSACHVKGGYVDGTYMTYSPQEAAKAAGGQLSPKQKDCWSRCVRYAGDLLDGKLPRLIGDRNMIANPAKDKKSALDAWGGKCDLAIEGHRFGYDRRHDGYVKYGRKKPANLTHAPAAQKIYVVKKGDSLWNIAKSQGTTVREIKAKNGLKSDVIRPGQTLKV